MKEIKFEVDESVQRKPTISDDTKERDSLNVLTNNGQNRTCPKWRRRKTNGLSIVGGFQLNVHKVDG